VLERQISIEHIAVLSKAADERRPRRAIVGNRCSGDERPNAIYSGRALRGDSERPNGCRATKKYDKFPSPHGFARAEDYIGYQKQYHILGREGRSLHQRPALMSALGQKATSSPRRSMSALLLKADIAEQASQHF